MAALITLPIQFGVPSTFRMTLGLTFNVGMRKCSANSGDMKFSVVPIFWAPASHRPTGYYLQDQQTYEYNPVEFIDNYWYFLDDKDEQVTTLLSSRIEPNTLGTGYWHIYNLKHSLFQQVPVPSTSAVTLNIPAEPQGGLLTDDPA